MQNESPEFDALIRRSLGSYVYVLKDPTQGGKVFYVGKGGGNGAGNERVLHHFEEARRALHLIGEEHSLKVQRIHQIWAEGKDVEWEIIRFGIPDSATALIVEAAVMDGFGRQNLTNKVDGHGTSSCGRLTSQEVYRLAAPSVTPSGDYEVVLLFNIDRSLRRSRKSAYDATRGWWSGTKRFEQARYAVGLVRGISVCVIEIERWLSREDDAKQRGIEGVPGDYDGKQGWEKGKLRRGFEGRAFLDGGSHELLNKNYQHIIERAGGYWKRGNWLAVDFRSGVPHLLRPAKS
jgi:hypothetical protein